LILESHCGKYNKSDNVCSITIHYHGGYGSNLDYSCSWTSRVLLFWRNHDCDFQETASAIIIARRNVYISLKYLYFAKQLHPRLMNRAFPNCTAGAQYPKPSSSQSIRPAFRPKSLFRNHRSSGPYNSALPTLLMRRDEALNTAYCVRSRRSLILPSTELNLCSHCIK